MSKFTQLQAGAMLQLVGDADMAPKLSERARQFAAVSALVVAATISSPVLAQNGQLSPGACASFGSGIGAIVGGILGGDSWEKRSLGAAMGAFGGAVAGNMACAPKEPDPAQQVQQGYQQPQVNPVARAAMNQSAQQRSTSQSRGTAHAPVGVQPGQYAYEPDNTDYFAPAPKGGQAAVSSDRLAPANVAVQPAFTDPKLASAALKSRIDATGFELKPLSSAEAARLDQMTSEVIAKKQAWKDALHAQVGGANNTETVEATRLAFEADRKAYSLLVMRLSQGAQKGAGAQVAPRDVTRYLQVSASLLELPTQRSVTWKQMAQADLNLQVRNPAYNAEVGKVMSMRAK